MKVQNFAKYQLNFANILEIPDPEYEGPGSRPDRIIDNRLKNLREKLTQAMYDYTCLGTFEVRPSFSAEELLTGLKVLR